MVKTYRVTGMTCQGCIASVKEKLSAVKDVENVIVNLTKAEVQIESGNLLSIQDFQNILPDKYNITEKIGVAESDVASSAETPSSEQSKWVQLRPLFLIFFYLFGASYLLNFQDWNTSQAMLDFMGLFYIVFSFFKFLDLKGFPDSFRMYDPLAKAIPIYGWLYPFIEVGLGLMFLMRFQITIALVATIVILGVTTFGVAKTLMNKKSIRCACLGTALKLPMTEATIIENTIMLIMAISMLASRL